MLIKHLIYSKRKYLRKFMENIVLAARYRLDWKLLELKEGDGGERSASWSISDSLDAQELRPGERNRDILHVLKVH